MAFFDRLKTTERTPEQERLEEGLEKTRTSFFGKLSRLVRGKDTVDEETLDALEEILVTSDVGVATTLGIIKLVEARVAQDKYVSAKELNVLIRDEMARLLLDHAPERPADFEAALPSGRTSS